MRIYVASSWRNEARQQEMVRALRANGHEVYEFFRDHVLTHPIAQAGFLKDMTALRTADATVLVLPCGRSAHLELGFATGAKQFTIVMLDDPMSAIASAWASRKSSSRATSATRRSSAMLSAGGFDKGCSSVARGQLIAQILARLRPEEAKNDPRVISQWYYSVKSMLRDLSMSLCNLIERQRASIVKTLGTDFDVEALRARALSQFRASIADRLLAPENLPQKPPGRA